MGPEFQSSSDVLCAVAGASFALMAGGRRVAMHEPFVLHAGERLRFGERIAGARATLAFGGGVAVEPVFGSRATSLISGVGPLGGRPLRAGDVLPIGVVDPASTQGRDRAAALAPPLRIPSGGAELRVIPGPHVEWFTASAMDALLTSRFAITPSSNRMGYRLAGARIDHAGSADILSDATAIGSIQVPASGQPILLMADRQTTGGYPKIATVIGADLPLAGQLAPGDWIEFRQCSREAAVDARRRRFRPLEARRL